MTWAETGIRAVDIVNQIHVLTCLGNQMNMVMVLCHKLGEIENMIVNLLACAVHSHR